MFTLITQEKFITCDFALSVVKNSLIPKEQKDTLFSLPRYANP